jgi:hypothetical protein
MSKAPNPSSLVSGCLPSSGSVFGSRPITPFHSDSGLLVSPACRALLVVCAKLSDDGDLLSEADRFDDCGADRHPVRLPGVEQPSLEGWP